MKLYESLFQRLLFPLYESGLRRRKTLALLCTYEASQWLSRDEIMALQWRKLKDLLAHCYREVPYYRNLWRGNDTHPDDIRSPEDYARLPTLDKSIIRANFDDLQAQSWRGRLLFKRTGGSTGEPLKLGYTRESYERRVAVMWRGYGWAGARMGRRTLYLWGGMLGDPTRTQLLRERLYHAAFARRMLDSFDMSEANMAEYADAIDRYRPEIIVAYVGPLVRLAEWLLATGRRVARPAAILGAAEAMHDFQRKIIASAFADAPVFNTYGCREFMLIAAECDRHRGLHVNADHLRVEIIGADDNAAGELVITDLHNYGMPFIRYRNGDLAAASAATCDCRRGLPLLERVEGRVLDALRTRDGRIVPGEFFPHMLKDVDSVRQFQVVQRDLDSLDVTLVTTADFDADTLEYIRRQSSRVFGDAVELRFVFRDHVALTPSGKLRVTRSELPASHDRAHHPSR